MNKKQAFPVKAGCTGGTAFEGADKILSPIEGK